MNNEPFPDRHDGPHDSNPPQVPPELIRRLHDAHDRFSRAKQHLEGMLDSDLRIPGEPKKVRSDLHAAEEEVEQVTREVNQVLKIPDPPPSAPPPNPA